MHWLIDAEARQRVDDALASGVVVTAEQRAAFEAARPSALSTDGATAHIAVTGVLVASPNPLLSLFGVQHTAYSELISALETADESDDVRDIALYVDSPGGAVDGMFDALAAIEGVRKPMRVRAKTATSAAYALAAAAGPIEATSPAARFGSIGIAVEAMVNPDVVEITSTHAPDKRPDVTTEEGRAVVRRHLDAIHDLFVGAISRGRKTTAKDVNANFGRGAVMLAAEAAQRGMIDSHPEPGRARAETKRATGAQGTKGKQMDLNELKAQHPHLVAQLLEQGREEGAKAERRRCSDHLKLSAAAGAHEQGAKAIEDGTAVADMQATYLAAHMNRQAVQATQDDSNAVGNAAGSGAPEAESDLEEKVHAETIKLLKGGAHG